MSLFRQIGAVTAANLRSLPRRMGSSSVIVLGIAGAAGVLVSVLAMRESLTETMVSTARDDRAIVMSENTNNEGASALPIDAALTVAQAPGIARTAAGEPAASAEIFASTNLLRRGDGNRAGVIVRGVEPPGLTIRSELELVEGRPFVPGVREVIVGRAAQREFQGLALDGVVELRDGPWTIVGVFSTGGTADESGFITDADTLRSAYQRSTYSSVRVQLESPAAFDAFRDALTTDPTLSVNVLDELTYYRQAADALQTLFGVITNVVGGIMAAGALLAALNTMYSAVSTRGVEIATLRAIGFGPTGVAVSVLAEALALATVGALLGGAAAALLFGGNVISLGGGQGSVVAELSVGGALMGKAVLAACVVGLIGALAPAVRACRQPIAVALRAT